MSRLSPSYRWLSGTGEGYHGADADGRNAPTASLSGAHPTRPKRGGHQVAVRTAADDVHSLRCRDERPRAWTLAWMPRRLPSGHGSVEFRSSTSTVGSARSRQVLTERHLRFRRRCLHAKLYNEASRPTTFPSRESRATSACGIDLERVPCPHLHRQSAVPSIFTGSQSTGAAFGVLARCLCDGNWASRFRAVACVVSTRTR